MGQAAERRLVMVLRWTIRVVAALVLVALVLAAVALWRLRGALPQLDGEREVRGIDAAVVIERDARASLTVRAGDADDAAFGLGFAHAQDRYFQMDMLRRAAAGELAALFGTAALDFDRRARVHGFRGVAQRALREEDPALRRRVESYACGVAAGLRSLRVPPFEYQLLRRRPQPWSPEDTFLVALAMYRDLQDETAGVERARAVMVDALPPDELAFLWPESQPWDAPLRGGAGKEPRIPPAPLPDEGGEAIPPPGDEQEADTGSNAWAVGGARTTRRAALLANDMHLGLSVPSTWYRVRLVWADGEDSVCVVGVSLPGAPGVLAGSNGHLAWGFTNSYGDWLDLVVIEPTADGQGYRTPEGTASFGERVEVIEVAGVPADTLRVRTTRWGPLVEPDHRGRPLALRWAAHDPAALNVRLLRLMELRDLEAALDLGPSCGMPHQNLLLAASDGRVGWTLAGRVPRREGLDGRVPRSWAEPGVGWVGWLEAAEVPRVVESPAGLIWSANARMVTVEEQRRLGDGAYALGARATQIRDRLRQLDGVTEADLLELQLDDRALFLARWRDLMLTVLDTGSVRTAAVDSIRAQLVRWEGRAATTSVGYRLVQVWRKLVLDRIWWMLTRRCRELDEGFRFRDVPRRETAAWALLSARPADRLPGDFARWDDFLGAMIDSVAARATAERPLSAWTWGARNRVRLRHPFSRSMPLLARWLDLPARSLPGDAYMPRVQGPTHGASERLVVTPGHEEEGILHLPGGQSGHPLSPHYRDQQGAWERGEPVPLLPGPSIRSLRLRPSDDGD